jgi:hypothetical protein
MKVLPIHRLQKYFRELEQEEALKMADFMGVKLANDLEAIPYIGGPTELMQALDAELAREEPPRPARPPGEFVYRVESRNGDKLILWLTIGVLAWLLLWRW